MNKTILAITTIIALTCFVSCQNSPDPELSIGQAEYSISGDGGRFSVKVATNVAVSIKISDGWIRQTSVSPDKSTFFFTVACNDSYGSCDARTGSVTFANSENGLLKTVTVRQDKGSPLIVFKDQVAKEICVKQWDANQDGEFSEKEAAAVKELQGDFYGVSSFDELKHFTSLKTIPDNFFNGFRNLTSISFPDGLEIIGNGAFINCSSLSRLVIPSSVKSIGKGALGGIPLSRIDVLAETPPALSDNEFAWVKDDCVIYVPAGKAPLYQEAEGWRIYCYRITEEGHSPFDFLYTSTDYSKDGEVVCLQEATEGKGIVLIFLGDGFLDKDMEPGGKYESVMRQWMEQFFVYEPYKTFRDWFSIYAVKVISKHGFFGSPELERKLTKDTAPGGDTDQGGNQNTVLIDVCDQYAGLVPNPDGQEHKVCVFLNTDSSVGRSWCDWQPDGSCLGVIFESIGLRPTVVNHELGGHGFAFLDDEYSLYDKPHPNAQEAYENAWQYGMLLNLDWRSDPEQVRWSRFLKDPRYSEEGLGVFEGGGYYSKGVFRPTENSMMRMDYAPGAVFNAPSREAIYRHIMRLGLGEDWTFDYETFVEADKAGRQQAAEAYSRQAIPQSSFGKYAVLPKSARNRLPSWP